jgi:hypothetical protein
MWDSITASKVWFVKYIMQGAVPTKDQGFAVSSPNKIF